MINIRFGALEYTDEQYEKDMEEIKKQINVEDLNTRKNPYQLKSVNLKTNFQKKKI